MINEFEAPTKELGLVSIAKDGYVLAAQLIKFTSPDVIPMARHQLGISFTTPDGRSELRSIRAGIAIYASANDGTGHPLTRTLSKDDWAYLPETTHAYKTLGPLLKTEIEKTHGSEWTRDLGLWLR